MTIGIFITSLYPRGASQSNFQGAVLEGLRKHCPSKYRLVVFAYDLPEVLPTGDLLNYVQLRRHGWWLGNAQRLKLKSARVILRMCGLLRLKKSRFGRYISRMAKSEPPYYKQFRDLNVRLLWNLNQHELPTWLPYIRTVWDLNQRLHPMYPEYSYSRYTFDGLDANMTNSLARASYVVVGTEEGKRQAVSMYGAHESKFRVIPFPTPMLPFGKAIPKRESQFAARRPYLFYPARFWPHKNHTVIIEAIRLLRDNHNISLFCVFSGEDEGNLDYVLKYAERLGVRDLVEHVGLVPLEELAGLYCGAIALVYASAVGPDNLPPLEAMSLGCPVITAEVPGAHEQYGDAAVYFNPMDERELAIRIKDVLQDGELREILIERGRERAASWTSEDYVRSITSIFDEFSQIARAWDRCDSEFT